MSITKDKLIESLISIGYSKYEIIGLTWVELLKLYRPIAIENEKVYFQNYRFNHKLERKAIKEKNKYKEKVKSAVYYQKNKTQILLKQKFYIEKNKEKIREKRQSKRVLVLTHYCGGQPKCECCGELHLEFLNLHHKHLNGTNHRKEINRYGSSFYQWIISNNYPEGFKVLCYNCNMCIGFYSECYHKNQSIKAKDQFIFNRKFKVLSHYSNGDLKCTCCSERVHFFLATDHINKGGTKHREEIGGHTYKWIIDNNFPPDFRVLCHNCNSSLGHYGYCPHRIDREKVLLNNIGEKI